MDKRKVIRFIFFGITLILALPFGFGRMTGFSYWFSPFILLNSVFVLRSIVVLNLIGFAVLLLAWFRNRWFCKYICPVGVSFEIVKLFRPRKRILSLTRVPYFNKWLAIISIGGALFGFPVFLFLDPMVIFNGFFTSFIQPFAWTVLLTYSGLLLLLILEFFIPGLWCRRICPLGGLQLSFSELKNFANYHSSKAQKFEVARRLFIGGAIGTVAANVLPDFIQSNAELSIRPPGSIENRFFNTLCIRCGSCIKACPTHILVHESRFGIGLLTPKIKFDDGYCLEKCNMCSVVCPSGAITPFRLEEKKNVKIGMAKVSFDKCLLMKQKECAVCINVCHYDSICIVEYSHMSLGMKPEINANNCTGCGACAIICPENCISIEAI